MNTIFLILGVLVIGLLCLETLRYISKKESRKAMREYEKRRMQQTALVKQIRKNTLNAQSHRERMGTDLSSNLIIKRQMHRVRIPWGWPGHEKINEGGVARPGLSDRMHSYINRLMREKELLSGHSGNPRISGSVRALLEERYGPVDRDSMDTIEYTKVKPPLLRDPSEPHDQMDNFGTLKTEQVRAKIKRVASMSVDMDTAAKRADLRYVDPEDFKQPWGW